MAIVIGAESWFFVATGWLGYYDSWLFLGLLTVSFSQRRWLLCSACLLTPWIDERFFIGFPLALLVRWLDDPQSRTSPRDLLRGSRREGLQPGLLVLVISMFRSSLACGAGRFV
jgi:hypothetical protein